jgi:hypothetical protein
MAWTFTPQSVWLLGTNELFEVTKVLIRGRKSRKDNSMAKRKRTNNDLHNTTQ